MSHADLSVKLARAALVLDEVVTELEAASLTDQDVIGLMLSAFHVQLASDRLEWLLDRLENYGSTEMPPPVPISARHAVHVDRRAA
jgi:hypothetical protein